MAGIDLSELVFLAATLVLAGVLTGVMAGLFGVGGGIVLVPVLYEVFGALHVPQPVRMPLCVGTSLAVIVPTAIRSYRAHRAQGVADDGILRQWAAAVVLGVIAGTIVARWAPPGLFKAVFAAVAAVAAIRLLWAKDGWRIADELPSPVALRAAAGLIGALSALMGVGGGVLANLYLMLYGRPIHQAVATSSGMGVLIAIPGALGYVIAGWPQAAAWPEVAVLQPPLALGYVSLLGFALLTPASAWAAPWGARLAHRLPKRRLEIALGGFMLLVALRFVFSLWD